jgi:hypothetical protein
MRQPDEMVQVLYGCEAMYKNCVAYCRYHHCHLTEKQLKTKGCLGKRCRLLDKLEHQFWRDREEKKHLKALKGTIQLNSS